VINVGNGILTKGARQKMVKKIIRIGLFICASWGMIGFWLFKGHTDSVVPLMFALIVVLALGFIMLSEKP